MRPDYDFVIVGAGLTGSAAAVALARSGYRVAVIEQRDGPYDKTGDARALVLLLSSQAILERIGLWADVAVDAHALRRVDVSEAGGFAGMTLDCSELGAPALGWACPADGLLARFQAAMVAAIGDDVYFATRFTALRPEADGVVLQARQGDGLRTLTAHAVIAADGVDSAVVVAAGLAARSVAYGQQAVVAQISLEHAEPHTATEHFTAEGALAIIPTGAGRAVSVQCVNDATATQLMTLGDTQFTAVLAERGGARAGHILRCGPRRAHPLVRRMLTGQCDASVLVIGNAAAAVHPNGAQGLNLGLRDVAALQALLGAGRTPTACVPAFAALRTGDRRRVVGATDWLAQSARSTLPPLRWLRRAGLGLLALQPSLRRQLLREVTGVAALARLETLAAGQA